MVNLRREVLFLVMAVAIACYFGILFLKLLVAGKNIDFYHFYEGSRALIEGRNLYLSGRGGYIYPPFFAFLLIPIAYLPYQAACLVWLFINYILIFIILNLSLKFLTKIYHFPYDKWRYIGIGSLAVLLLYQPIMREILLAQCDTLVLMGIIISLFYLNSKPWLAGIILGVVANIKYQTLIFLLLFLLRGRWRSGVGLLVGVLIGAILPAIKVGWSQNLQYLLSALNGIFYMSNPHLALESPDIAAHVSKITWESSISITSGLARIFFDSGWSPLLLLIVMITIIGLFFGFFWWMWRRKGIPFFWRSANHYQNPDYELAIFNLEVNALLVAILIFSPQTTGRHLFLILYINVFAVAMLLLSQKGMSRRPILIGILMSQLGFILPKFISSWKYIGGTSWAILFFLSFITWASLKYVNRFLNSDINGHTDFESVYADDVGEAVRIE